MKRELASLQTKQALAQSLKKFMLKKPLSKVTVSEIIRDCDVNRKTFYYHFEDIYALVKWMLEQETFEVVKQYDLISDYEDAIRFTINYVKDNQHILCCAYDTMGIDVLKRFFYNDFIALAEKFINDTETKYHLSTTQPFKQFICQFFTTAIAGMIVNGFRQSKDIDEEEILANFSIILHSIPDILKRGPQQL